MWYIKI
jgi:hypothetical protein